MKCILFLMSGKKNKTLPPIKASFIFYKTSELLNFLCVITLKTRCFGLIDNIIKSATSLDDPAVY